MTEKKCNKRKFKEMEENGDEGKFWMGIYGNLGTGGKHGIFW